MFYGDQSSNVLTARLLLRLLFSNFSNFVACVFTCYTHAHSLIHTYCRTCDVNQTFRAPWDEYTNAYNPQILVSASGWLVDCFAPCPRTVTMRFQVNYDAPQRCCLCDHLISYACQLTSALPHTPLSDAAGGVEGKHGHTVRVQR